MIEKKAAKAESDADKPPLDSGTLWAAIQSGQPPSDFGALSSLVASERNIDGRNALMWACHLGNVEWACALAEVSNLAERDCLGRSAAMWAADSGIDMRIDKLIGEYDAIFDADLNGETVLTIAARRGNSHNMFWLLLCLYEKDVPRATAEMYAVAFDADPFYLSYVSAARQSHTDAVRKRIEALPANAVFGRRRTALHLAARHGLLAVVDRMLDEGADPRALDDALRTPLMEAVGTPNSKPIGTENLAVAQRLILLSDPLWVDSEGETALMKAAKADLAGMVDLLIPVSDPNARTSTGMNAHGFARSANHGQGNDSVALLATVTRRSERRHVPGRQDVQGRIFRTAARNGDFGKIARMLASETKRLAAELTDRHLGEGVDDRGRDALMIAAEFGNVGCIEILMACCDPFATDDRQNTALIMAARSGNTECVRLLLAASHPDARNQDGNTALMMAAGAGEVEVLRLLIPWCRADVVNRKGQTVATLAAMRGVGESVVLLASKTSQ